MSIIYTFPIIGKTINIKDNGTDPWTYIYEFEILDDKHNIINTISFGESRNIIDIYPLYIKNLLIIAYVNYIDNVPCLLIDFYNINDINKIKQHKIKINYACSSITGKLSVQTTTSDSCDQNINIIFGDLINYNYIEYICFNLETFYSPIRIKYDYDIYIDQIYLLNDKLIINADIVIINNIVYIKIYNLIKKESDSNTAFSITELSLDNIKLYDRLCDYNVYDFFYYNDKIYCLIRLKLNENNNLLYINPFFVDVIINISDNIIHCYNEPLYYDKKNDYEEYFGIKPYYIIKENELKIYRKT